MVRIDKNFELNTGYDLSRIGTPDRLLFFDIETTGLSASSSSLYLLGCMYVEEEHWHFTQWLIESFSDELPVLRAFSELLSHFDTAVTFNGDSFDINYLNMCAKEYGLSDLFDGVNSFDLIKKVRPLKRFLALPDCKLKTVERFLGIYREDPFTGGELIEVYEEFTRTHDLRLQKTLLLHNEEDILNMPPLLQILAYSDFLCGTSLSLKECYFNLSGTKLSCLAEADISFPVPVTYTNDDGITVSLSGTNASFEIPSFSGELKYFYPNVKDYWYLPMEDQAYHKKIAGFVAKEHRVPATKETCYTRMEGFFLPAFSGCENAQFRKSFSDPERFVRYEENKLADYLEALVHAL